MALHVRQLTDRERTALSGLATSPYVTATTKVRASIILLSDQGWYVPQIARKTGKHHHSVRLRVRRFNSTGLASLKDLPRSGRPPIYKQQRRQEVVRVARTDPETLGLAMDFWTYTALRQYLAQHGMPGIGRETIRRILRAEGAALPSRLVTV